MCSIGEKVSTKCSDGEDCKGKDMFSKEDWKLLHKRSGCEELVTVCNNHQLVFLKLFYSKNKNCCDPKRNHQGLKKALRKRITLSLSRKAQSIITLVPSKALCKDCYDDILRDTSTLLTPGTTASESEEEDENEEQVLQKPLSEDPFGNEESATSSPLTLSPGVSQSTGPSAVASQESTSSVSSGGENSISILNKFLSHKKQSPVSKREAQQSVSYLPSKIAKVTEAVKEVLEKVVEEPIENVESKKDFEEMMTQLKEKIKRSSSRQEKVNVLSTLPSSWNIKKILEHFEEFGATRSVVINVKKLVEEKGIFPILSSPYSGRAIPYLIKNSVLKFYEEDEMYVYYILPDKNQSISVKITGEKVHKQKRILLCNLKELYSAFKSQYPEFKISFSKFAELRPKYCVLAGGPGTHSVCVGQEHENVKLMIDGIKLKNLTKDSAQPIENYKQCLSLIRCDPPSEKCVFGVNLGNGKMEQCDSCPGPDFLRELLEVHLDAEMLDSVTYNSWLKGARFSLETVSKSKDDFINEFLQIITNLKEHDFLAHAQREYLKNLKRYLPVGEAIVLMDFTEKYSAIIQSEVQGYHWSHNQATVHPFVIYFRQDGSKDLQHKNFVVISDCMKHNASTIYAFQTELVTFIKREIPGLRKINYFSDSTVSQYRNRFSFVNLCHHSADFDLAAEWIFFETAHGKSPCDGIGGTVKRAAARASLQGQLIRNAKELFQWATNKWKEESGSSPRIVVCYEKVKRK